jgi:alpha-methylacyl-CoA racemase
MGGSADPSGTSSAGPLSGIRVLELAAIGPAPHAAFVLGSLGADVVRVSAPSERPGAFVDLTASYAREVRLDLKSDEQRAQLLRLVAEADVLVEGFRPGVAERLGVGPDDCHAVNPALVYGRMSGWGQDGPWALRAGHDINYLSVTGALEAIGSPDHPAPPLNLVGDYAGGSLQLVIGVLAALVRRNTTGQGEVVDAAIVDGVPVLMELVYALDALGLWSTSRGSNLLDGGVPFYRTYACADGRFVAVGALEPKFYAELVAGLGLAPDALPDRDDQSQWPTLARVLHEAFAARTRDEWAAVFEGTDACVTPVLDYREAADHAHLRARGSVTRTDGRLASGPSPRFAAAAAGTAPTAHPRASTVDAVLEGWVRRS